MALQSYLDASLQAVNTGSAPPSEHTNSTVEERNALGRSLLEASVEWKRILSPMLTFVLVQEALILLLRLKGASGPGFASKLTFKERETFQVLLERLKSMTEAKRTKLRQRHESWVDTFRDQVDMVPGSSVTGNTKKVKRVVNSHELADLLDLANKMKTAGNESFNSGDFRMAVTRYVQVEQQLGGIRALRAGEQRALVQLRRTTQRNLSLAALKNFEWGRAKRTCDALLGPVDPEDAIPSEEPGACQGGMAEAARGGAAAERTSGTSPPFLAQSQEVANGHHQTAIPAGKADATAIEAPNGRETSDAPGASTHDQPPSISMPLPASPPPLPPPPGYPVDPVVLVRRAEALMQLGRFDDALRDVDHVLRLAKEEPAPAVGKAAGASGESRSNQPDSLAAQGTASTAAAATAATATATATMPPPPNAAGVATARGSGAAVEAAVVRKAQRLRQAMREASKKSEDTLKAAFGAVAPARAPNAQAPPPLPSALPSAAPPPALERGNSRAAATQTQLRPSPATAGGALQAEKGGQHSLRASSSSSSPAIPADPRSVAARDSAASRPAGGLAEAGIFSSNREFPEKGAASRQVVEPPRLERLRLRREAEEREKAKLQQLENAAAAAATTAASPGGLTPRSTSTSTSTSTNGAGARNGLSPAPRPPPPPPPPPPLPRRDLTLAEVEEIQREQHALFSSPSASARLEAMRFASELQEVRFLHRLKPFKLELQRGLLAARGFEQTEQGLRDMERAVARHMLPENPEVGRRAKALMCLIMGDIWDESAAL